MSPSMLRGPALRSLEILDSSKFFETVQESNRLDVQHAASLPVTKMLAKIEENGPTKSIVCEKSTPAVGITDAKSWHMSAAPDAKNVAISVPSSSPLNPPLKKQAFQMTAREDYLEFDDGEYPNGSSAFKLPHVRGNLDTVLVENKSSAPETSGLEKPSTIAEVKSATTSILRHKTVGTSDGFVFSEKSSNLRFPAASVPSETFKQATKDKHSTEASNKATLTKELAGVPSISIGDGVVSVKKSNGSPSKFAPKPVDQVSQFAFAPPPSSSNAEMGSSSRLMTEELELEKPDHGSSLKEGVLSLVSETAFSASSAVSVSSGIFSFSGSSVNSSSLSNGSLSFPLFSSSNGSSSILAAASATVRTTSGSSSLPISASAPSFSAAQVFKFGSPSVPLTLASSAAATTTLDSTEANAKGPSSSNFSSTPFDGTSSSLASTGSTLFSSSTTMTSTGGTLGGTPGNLSTGSSNFGSVFGMASTTSNQPESVTPFTVIAAQSSTLGFIPTSVESLPKHHQSNSSAPSLFGLVENTSFSSGSSLLTSSTSNAKLFSSGPSFMLSSTHPSSEASSVGSSTSITSSVFGSSTGTSSTVCGSSTSTTSTVFGCSTGTTSAVFGSSTSTTSTVFGSSTSPTSTVFGFSTSPKSSAFGSRPSPTSSAFDSSTSPTSAVFGSSTSPTSSVFSSSTSTTSTVFGSSTSPTSSLFGSSWQTPKSPVFGAASSISTSTGLVFGLSATSSVATSGSTPVVFGSSISASASSPFLFISSASAPSQSMFGNSTTGFTVGSSPASNGDQMNMDDNMAEDTVRAAPPTPMFGQQPMPTPSSGFVFGSPNPSGLNHFGASAGASPFQFGGQPNVATPANPSPFQASGSLEFNAGGSFSLGTAGGDKSSRRIVRVKKGQRKK